MNRTDIVLSMIERANTGPVLSPEDAISMLAEVIDHLEPASDYHLADITSLIEAGACIWQLQQN